MSTLLCVPILVHDAQSALADAAAARDHGADIVEFRVDACFSGSGDEAETHDMLRLAAESPLPCIITCRPTWEGGHYDGPEDARVALFERLGTGDSPPAYIDAELAAYTRSANLRQKVNLAVDHPKQVRPVATRLILSMHDFDGRPADLSRRLAAMRAEPPRPSTRLPSAPARCATTWRCSTCSLSATARRSPSPWASSA